MDLEAAVLSALEEHPLSGGTLIERFQAASVEAIRGQAVVVYAALARLHAAGRIVVVGEGPGERVWGLPETPAQPPAPVGFPPSFALGDSELALIDRAVWRVARGLPGYYFEELRRVVVADADRRVFFGGRLPRAAAQAIEELGPAREAHRYLRRLERGRSMPLVLTGRRSRKLYFAGGLLALLVLLRIFVVGVYTVPPDSISMAPTLIPAADGGDRLVLADLVSYRLRDPRRGEVVLFRLGEDPEIYVKRVMGLPGEKVKILKDDLFIDGKRLVKERELLDRVKVPLLDLEDLERTTNPPGWLQPKEAIHAGFRLPDGERRVKAGICRDIVVTARVVADSLPASITFALDEGRPARHLLVLDGKGFTAGVAVGGIQQAQGAAFRLEPGVAKEIWLTNADGVFRVEIDGREVARAPIELPPRWAELTITPDGPVHLEQVEIARDLIYESEGEPERTLGEHEYFVLGDFSHDSRDSRLLGPIPGSAIFGRVFAVVWPPGRIRGIGAK